MMKAILVVIGPSQEHYKWCRKSLIESGFPEDDIIVVSDNPEKGIDFNSLTPWNFAEFQKLYYHNRPNPESFERACFAKWFAVDELLRRGIDVPVLVCDNDVLWNVNPAEQIHEIDGRFGIVLPISPITYVFEKEALSDLCRYFITAQKWISQTTVPNADYVLANLWIRARAPSYQLESIFNIKSHAGIHAPYSLGSLVVNGQLMSRCASIHFHNDITRMETIAKCLYGDS